MAIEAYWWYNADLIDTLEVVSENEANDSFFSSSKVHYLKQGAMLIFV
jgi:hypothetical protein